MKLKLLASLLAWTAGVCFLLSGRCLRFQPFICTRTAENVRVCRSWHIFHFIRTENSGTFRVYCSWAPRSLGRVRWIEEPISQRIKRLRNASWLEPARVRTPIGPVSTASVYHRRFSSTWASRKPLGLMRKCPHLQDDGISLKLINSRTPSFTIISYVSLLKVSRSKVTVQEFKKGRKWYFLSYKIKREKCVSCKNSFADADKGRSWSVIWN